MESNRERGGRDRGIEDRYKYSYDIMDKDRYTVQEQGDGQGQKDNDKVLGTKGQVQREGGTVTSTRTLTGTEVHGQRPGHRQTERDRKNIQVHRDRDRNRGPIMEGL